MTKPHPQWPDGGPVIWVAGFCQREDCGRPFVTWVRARTSQETWPKSCSATCQRAMSRRRRSAAVAQSGINLCRGCWSQPRVTGRLCVPCVRIAQRSLRAMCLGKKRFADRAAAEAAADRVALLYSDEMVTYLCPVCDQWHMGHHVLRAKQKRDRFMANMYAPTLSPECRARLASSFGKRRRRWPVTT